MGGFVVYGITACLIGLIAVNGNRKRWQDFSDIQPAEQKLPRKFYYTLLLQWGGVDCGISCYSMWKVVTEIAEASSSAYVFVMSCDI